MNKAPDTPRFWVWRPIGCPTGICYFSRAPGKELPREEGAEGLPPQGALTFPRRGRRSAHLSTQECAHIWCPDGRFCQCPLRSGFSDPTSNF